MLLVFEEVRQNGIRLIHIFFLYGFWNVWNFKQRCWSIVKMDVMLFHFKWTSTETLGYSFLNLISLFLQMILRKGDFLDVQNEILLIEITTKGIP